METEIAKEQDHVDRVRAQLEIDENKARMLAKAGQDMYRSDRTSWVREEDGTAMFERDAFSYNAAKRLAVLDAEHAARHAEEQSEKPECSTRGFDHLVVVLLLVGHVAIYSITFIGQPHPTSRPKRSEVAGSSVGGGCAGIPVGVRVPAPGPSAPMTPLGKSTIAN